MTDGEIKQLTKDAVRGKSSAFGPLYDHYQPMIYRFVLFKVSRREDAEDLTHQVFLLAWQNIKSYKEMGHPFSSWLYQIARNQVIDHYRSKKSNVSIDNVDPEVFATSSDGTQEVGRKLELEKVGQAIAKLKTEYQDVVIMRFIEDLPIKEVAGILGKTEGAIKLMQHRAIKELKELVGEKE